MIVMMIVHISSTATERKYSIFKSVTIELEILMVELGNDSLREHIRTFRMVRGILCLRRFMSRKAFA